MSGADSGRGEPGPSADVNRGATPLYLGVEDRRLAVERERFAGGDVRELRELERDVARRRGERLVPAHHGRLGLDEPSP